MSEVGKALEAAAMAECLARAKVNNCAPEPCSSPCVWCAAGASAAVAVFLRHYSKLSPTALIYGPAIADAVEAAAREADHG